MPKWNIGDGLQDWKHVITCKRLDHRVECFKKEIDEKHIQKFELEKGRGKSFGEATVSL